MPRGDGDFTTEGTHLRQGFRLRQGFGGQAGGQDGGQAEFHRDRIMGEAATTDGTDNTDGVPRRGRLRPARVQPTAVSRQARQGGKGGRGSNLELRNSGKQPGSHFRHDLQDFQDWGGVNTRTANLTTEGAEFHRGDIFEILEC